MRMYAVLVVRTSRRGRCSSGALVRMRVHLAGASVRLHGRHRLVVVPGARFVDRGRVLLPRLHCSLVAVQHA